jgi:hypothetical protein
MPQDRQPHLADLVTPFTDEIARHLALPPLQRNRSRAMWGAFFLAGTLYVADRFKATVGGSIVDLVRMLARLPGTTADVWWPFAAWGACAALGLLWLVVGVRGYRGAPRDIMAALWAAVIGGFFAAALWYGWYLPAEWAGLNFLLGGLYWAMLAAELVSFWLTARGPHSGNALKLVTQQIQRQAVTWRTGKRRQF